MSKLFEPVTIGPMSLKNRVVMAPMTRSRAIGNIPNELMVEYYSARASAGLIVTEGTSPSPNGLGYARIPGIFNLAQVQGWQQVTRAVHENGGHIFVQLMHTGRVGHAENLPPGARVLGPSALALPGTMWTDTRGMQPHPVPEVMSEADIHTVRQEYARASEYAMQAGFDGVELHAANGYLLEQFLNPNVNQRTDSYGASAQGRMKFLLEVAADCAARIGANRVGVRVSPYGTFNATGAFDRIDEFYAELAAQLSALGLLYIHVVDHSSQGAPPVSDTVKRLIRENFSGAYVLSGGYDRTRAERDLEANKGDLVAFGRPYLANPDFVEKLASGAELNDFDASKLYTPGPEGYTAFSFVNAAQ